MKQSRVRKKRNGKDLQSLIITGKSNVMEREGNKEVKVVSSSKWLFGSVVVGGGMGK